MWLLFEDILVNMFIDHFIYNRFIEIWDIVLNLTLWSTKWQEEKHWQCLPVFVVSLIVFLPVHSTFLVSILTLIVFLPVHSTFLVSILTLSLYSYLYIQHSLSAYWHSHCIPTCTFKIPCNHTGNSIVFLPVHSTFLVSILTLEKTIP
jgi:hypothetical protein